MDKASTSIPELFYDLLSRVIPGVVVTTGLLVLFILSGNTKFDATLVVNIITSITFLVLVSTIAYVLGFLLGTVSQALDVIFRYGYNPATDYLEIDNAKKQGKKFIYYLEIILGLPFSLFLINEYKPISNYAYLLDLKEVIRKRFGKTILESHMNVISCRDYIRATNAELGSIVMKMAAESAMCRNLVIVFLILLLVSIHYSLGTAIFASFFLLTLSFANFSYRRRLYVQQIYRFFFAIEKGGFPKSASA